jgi:hypothetical protein
MIQLKPEIENHFACPECKALLPDVNDVLVQSVHVMADCTCGQCNLQFYQVFPVSHNIQGAVSVEKKPGKFYRGAETESWLFDAFVKAHQGERQGDVKIEKIVFRHCDEVLILNTLDYLYGHVLLKLYNALHHLDHQKDLGLILIIPKMFAWLIPAGCAEAWVVDLKLGDLAYNHKGIQDFVSRQFVRFKSVYLSRAYSHPDFTAIDISRLTGIKPFDLTRFRDTRPTITFILREDRWWSPSGIDSLLIRVCRKLKVLSWGSRILTHRQNRLVKRTIAMIRKKIPDAGFGIAGLGKTGSFRGHAEDRRETVINPSIELAWCDMYARSHVVVGVHGSNMLLPTALAAGCVEILPEERYGNMVQDISVRYSDRRQLFFYRFADQYSAPRTVSAKVTGIIDHYDTYHKNMCLNLYRA